MQQMIQTEHSSVRLYVTASARGSPDAQTESISEEEEKTDFAKRIECSDEYRCQERQVEVRGGLFKHAAPCSNTRRGISSNGLREVVNRLVYHDAV